MFVCFYLFCFCLKAREEAEVKWNGKGGLVTFLIANIVYISIYLVLGHVYLFFYVFVFFVLYSLFVGA